MGTRNIDLSNLTDAQSIWLTQVSYLDITDEGKALINDPDGGLTISELRNYLSEGDHASFGNILGDTELSQIGAARIIGEDLTTDLEVLDKLEELGFGDVEITAIAENYETGFSAMCFKDDAGNTGFSFRGSDFNWDKGAFIGDWYRADSGEWAKGDSEQVHEALQFFKDNADQNGKNYAFGHSLGGNLTNHVFAENHEQMQGAFSFCGLGIDTDDLSPKQLEAFRGEKYDCLITTGDLVGLLKDHSAYENNVRYAAVRDDLNHNFVTSHVPQSLQMDGENIVPVETHVAEKQMNKVLNAGGRFLQNSQNIVNYGVDRINELRQGNYQSFASALRDTAVAWFDQAKSCIQQGFEKAPEKIAGATKDAVEKAPDVARQFGDAIANSGDTLRNIANELGQFASKQSQQDKEMVQSLRGVEWQSSFDGVKEFVGDVMHQFGHEAKDDVNKVASALSLDDLFGNDNFAVGGMREDMGFAEHIFDFARDSIQNDSPGLDDIGLDLDR